MVETLGTTPIMIKQEESVATEDKFRGQASSAETVDPFVVEETLLDLPCTLQVVSPDDETYTIFRVNVIQGGWGKNRRLSKDGIYHQDYFTPEFLQSLIPLLEGSTVQSVKLQPRDGTAGCTALPEKLQDYIQELQRYGHPPEFVNRLYDLGLVGNTIGWLKDVSFSSPHVQALFYLAPTAETRVTRELIRFAWTHGFQRSLGLSVNYRAKAEFTQIDGRPAFKFTTATHHVSTELVPNPAAGGGIVAVLQGVVEEMNTKQDPKDVQGTVSAPASDKPDKESPQKTEDVATRQSVSPQEPTPTVKEPENTTPEPARTPAIDINAIQAQVQADLTQKLTPVITQAVKQEVKQEMEREAQVKAEMEAVVTQSTVLDDATKQSILDDIGSGKLASKEAVAQMVEVAENAVNAAQQKFAAVQAKQGAPVFPGLQGATGVEIVKDPGDINRIRSNLLWGLPLTQNEQEMATKYGIDPFFGIKHEYQVLTRDEGLKFQYDPDYFRQAIGGYTQSITTASYPEFLRNVLRQRGEIHFNYQNKDWLKVVKKGDSFEDTRPEEEFVIGQFSDIPEVSEGGEYQDIGNPRVEKIVSEAKKYGGLLSFSEETILNNRTGFVKDCTELGYRAMNKKAMKLTWNNLTGFDGTAFNHEDLGDSEASKIPGGVLYHENRGNYINGQVNDMAAIKRLVNLMYNQVDIAQPGEAPEDIDLEPYLAICVKAQRGTVLGRLNGPNEPYRTDNFPNTLSLGIPKENVIGIHPNYLHGHPEALILLPDPRLFAAMELQYFRGREVPELVWEGDQRPQYGSVFLNDKLRLKLKWRLRLTRKRKKAFFGLFSA